MCIIFRLECVLFHSDGCAVECNLRKTCLSKYILDPCRPLHRKPLHLHHEIPKVAILKKSDVALSKSQVCPLLRKEVK